MTVGAVEEHTQDGASEGGDTLKHVSHKHTLTGNILCLVLALTLFFFSYFIPQVSHSKREREESEGKEQDEGSKESSLRPLSQTSGSHRGAAPPSGTERHYSGSSGRDREVGMESDRSGQKPREGQRSQERRKEEGSRTDGEGERSERSLRDDQDTQLHQNVPVPSHHCTDTAAGKQPSPPPLLLQGRWGGQKGPLPSEGLTGTSDPGIAAEEEKEGTDQSADGVVRVCRLQGDDTKKKGGQQGDAAGEGERAGSSSASQERRKECGRERTHKKEKREADHQLPEDWETHRHKRSKKSREGREH